MTAEQLQPGLIDRLFLRGYYRRLGKFLRTRCAGHDRTLAARIRVQAAEIADANRDMVVDKASRSHAILSATILATYRAFQAIPELRADALEQAMDLFLVTGKATAELGMRLLPYISRDPFRTMANISKTKQIGYYGKSFDHEIVEDTSDAFVFRVNRCFYHSFFVRHGAPELAATFCAKDSNWGDAIDPSKVGFSFGRPTTLASGGECCLFQFKRVAKPALKEVAV